MLKRFSMFFVVAVLLCSAISALGAKNPNDAPGSKDPSGFTRMPGFHIYKYEELAFDRFEFNVAANKMEAIEGKHYTVIYYADEGTTRPSAIQIAMNYVNAVKTAGGQSVYEFEDGGQQIATLKLEKNNMEIWASVRAGANGIYDLHVVERQLMKQDVSITAEKMSEGIKESGKIAIYGIYFDSGKADIKPESEAALKEITKMIMADPATKLYIVGHTDNEGAFDYNLKLSKDRAQAVVKYLTGKAGVSASLLQPHGAGPTSPVASNKTEEGRAKNRRVELVAQ